MSIKFLQILSAKKHDKKLTKKSPIFITSFVIAILSTIPASAQAGRADDLIDGLETRITNIQTKLNDLPGTVQGTLGIALDTDLVTNVKESISEITDVVKELKANRAAFGDGSPGTGCYYFKESLKSMFMNFGELSGALATIGNPNPPAVDLGDNNLIDNIPCKALLSASFAFEKTPLLEISDKLIGMNAALQELLPLFIVAPQNANFNSLSIDSPTTTELIHTDFCRSVVDRRDRITKAGIVLATLSVSLQVIAASIDTEVFTGGGDINKLRPKAEEVDAGIHGYAHVTLKRQKGRHKIAKGIEVFAKILDGVRSTATSIKNRISTLTISLLYIHSRKECLIYSKDKKR